MAQAPTPPKIRDDEAEVARFVEEIKEVADQLLLDRADRGDIKLLARALRELRYALKVLGGFRDRRKVTVFGSARTEPDTPLFDHAVAFGRAIAAKGFMVTTGAGPGIMEAGHVGAGAEDSIGLNILLPFEQGANKVIAETDKLINLRYFFTRKLLFLKEADALVLFPGGFGTLDEGFEILTMLQTGKTEMIPVVLIDVPGGHYWRHWAEYVDKCLYRAGMISKQDFSLFRITDSIDEAVEEIAGFYRVYQSQRYIRNHLTLRLLRAPAPEVLERINLEFRDILEKGEFRLGTAHRHEANEPHAADMPRLFFEFDRKSHGRLRELIDFLNTNV